MVTGLRRTDDYVGISPPIQPAWRTSPRCARTTMLYRNPAVGAVAAQAYVQPAIGGGGWPLLRLTHKKRDKLVVALWQ